MRDLIHSFQQLRIRLVLLMVLCLSAMDRGFAQTVYDSWLRSQQTWGWDKGVAAGVNTGLQFQYYNTYRRCKHLSKHNAFEFGIYYEGLIFGEVLKKSDDQWESGGGRVELAYLFYPNLNLAYHRFYLGGGFESGVRKFSGDYLFQSDVIAKAGWELCLLQGTKTPIILRMSLKYDQCLDQKLAYLLPEISLVFGR